MIDFTKLQDIQWSSPPTKKPQSYDANKTGSTASNQSGGGQGGDWQNFDWMKNYYGGRWYDFGAKEDQPGWWRAPRINPSGAEAVWNPQYGWQDWNQIAGLGGDYSGLSPQFGDVYDIFGANRPRGGGGGGSGGGGSGGGSGGGGGGGLSDDFSWDWGGNYPPMGGGAQAGQFPYPEEWDISSNVLSNFAQHGYPTDVPQQWGQASDFTNQMMQTGMPVHQSDWYQQAKGVAQTDITDAIKQAAEQARLGGLRWSTPLGRTAQDIAGRRMSQFGLESMDRELASGEAARGRQMGSLPYMYQFGAGEAGLAESAKQRALGATQQLMPLGQMRADLPQQLAQTAYGMGTGLYGQQQQGLQSLMQEWLRTQPENSPWMQYAMSMAGLPMPNMAPQQYNPSSLTSLLGGLGGMLPFLFM